MMLARTAISRTATCRMQSRSMTTAKMHRAKGLWEPMKSKRPIDHDDTHLVFHTPFNKLVAGGLLTGVFALGYGVMAYGVVHQQYKQGFWK